jgi:hypothetical protein
VAYTVEQIEAKIATLETGLVQVARGVTFADRGVTYKSPDELEQAIAYWQRKLAEASGTTRRAKQTYMVGGRGL